MHFDIFFRENFMNFNFDNDDETIGDYSLLFYLTETNNLTKCLNVYTF